MGTINMWAEKSSRVADARKNKPLQSTSTPANNALGLNTQESNAVTVITSFDAAKIRKDAETAIKNDEKFSHGNGADNGTHRRIGFAVDKLHRAIDFHLRLCLQLGHLLAVAQRLCADLGILSY